MSPQNRVSLHLYLLILYVSGCRPGMLQGIKWSDFTLYLMLDPDVPGKRRLVADLHLRFNKLKKNAVLLSTERLRYLSPPFLSLQPLAKTARGPRDRKADEAQRPIEGQSGQANLPATASPSLRRCCLPFF